jgi:uncharacterized protein (TIGR03089 family)
VTTPTDLLSRQLSRDGSRPLFTFYDDASGERVELSVATTANWVAKVANYLLDDHGIEPGDLVTIRLPLHWQSAMLLLASWAVGATVGFDDAASVDDASAVTFTDEPATDGSASADTVVLGLAPMGADFAVLVAAQPDAFVPLDAGGEDLVAAAATDLPAGSRVLSVLPYDGADAISYGLVAPLAVDGSVVLVRHPDPAKLAEHADTELVTHTLGVDVAGLPRLDNR